MNDVELGGDEYARSRLVLARMRVHEGTPLASVCSGVTALAAHTLGVERVGLWLFERGAQTLVCIDQFTRSTGKHTSGAELEARAMPVYVRALEEHREIVAPDARADARTRELTDSYLVPLGITSMLDAPVFRDGDVLGVLCHEHVGPARAWSEGDIAFAAMGAGVVAIAFEQSARLHAERRLRESESSLLQARKFEALGLMATKIAHDFNNILMVVQGGVDLLGTDDDQATREAILAAARSGSALVKQLLEFAKGPRLREAPPANVAAVVAGVVPMARTLAPGRIITAQIAPGDWPVRIDAGDAERFLLNLVANARDATEEGGEILLRVQGGPNDDPASVVIEVIDKGSGMDAATRARMFDPFFTTKLGAGGTGLGLSTVHGIVQSARGTIDVESEPGRGTTVRVRLPLAIDARARA